METIDFHIATADLYNKILGLDFTQLPVSDFKKDFIERIKPALFYNLKIYTSCFQEGLSKCDKEFSELTFVDYGGENGFLSMLAKQIGIGKVIYINPDEKAGEVLKFLQNETGVGPDIFLTGDSATFANWCKESAVCPDLLISTDVIEQIYDLHAFFQDLIGINDQMQMIFTTRATPYNPYIINRLYSLMRKYETGRIEKPNYSTKRKNYIKKTFSNLNKRDIKKWTLLTRGLMYNDIFNTITNNERPLLLNAYNTCDPETGKWVKRILPMRDYRDLVRRHGYDVEVRKGFYNTIWPKQWKSLLTLLANELIKHSGKAGLAISPFILLSFSRK